MSTAIKWVSIYIFCCLWAALFESLSALISGSGDLTLPNILSWGAGLTTGVALLTLLQRIFKNSRNS